MKVPTLDVSKGERVVVWGAWKVDGKRRWYWEGRRVARLGGTSPADANQFPPGHHIERLDARPKGSVPISKLRRRGDVVFEVDAHNGAITALEFTPDGGGLLTVGVDGMVRLFGVEN